MKQHDLVIIDADSDGPVASQMTQPTGAMISQSDSLALLTDRSACDGS